MPFYNTCPKCGANLDPGEKCDCESKEKEKREFLFEHIKVDSETGQLTFQWEVGK